MGYHIHVVDQGAVFSPDNRYRYTLWRVWDKSIEQVLFIGLNPSIANADHDDPTVRRCIGFAKTWGYGGMWIANIFAFISSSPRYIQQVADPVGPDNEVWIKLLVNSFSLVIACWGNRGNDPHRNQFIASLNRPLHCLAMTSSGNPAHPLYLPATATPIDFRPTTPVASG